MSFLKQHWRFTVPAVVVLCVLLLGVLTLYGTSTPPEPKTVYVMPERNPDNPLPVNTGGIPPHTSIASSTETIPGAAPAEKQTQTSDAIDDNLESCCPEISKEIVDGHSHDSALSYLQEDSGEPAAWEIEMQEYVAKQLALEEEHRGVAREVTSLLQNFLAHLSPEDQSSIINEAFAELSRSNLDDETSMRARQYLMEMLTPATGALSSRQKFISDAESVAAKTDALKEKSALIARQSPDVPY